MIPASRSARGGADAGGPARRAASRRLGDAASLLLALAALGAASAAAGPGEARAEAASEAAASPFGIRTEAWGPVALLGETIAPATTHRLGLPSSESFSGRELLIPVFAVRGIAAGPTLCLVAGVHGDEVNGIEVVRRTLRRIRPQQLRGMLLALPIANLSAFRRGSRYLPDRRDLNRYFPGSADGSAASRIANALFQGVIRHCDALVDLHTGSFHRKNLHHVRADLDAPRTAELARSYGAPLIVHHPGGEGTLRRSATDAGIAAITVEAGEPGRFDEQQVVETVAGIAQLLGQLGMRTDPREGVVLKEPSFEYRRTVWVRSNDGGILLSRVRLGDVVRKGQILGAVTDPLSDRSEAIRAPHTGRIFGMAFDQVVMPGFAAYHLAVDPGATPEKPEAAPSGVGAEPSDADDFEERPE